MKSSADTQISKKQKTLHENAIIVFIKNPVLGKVKTRLAATVGNERALTIYHELMHHTMSVTKHLEIDKYLFYSDFVDENDIWENDKFLKSVQFQTHDLGLKMASAFSVAFQNKHKKALIIGSDCLELNTEIIKEAYSKLSENEVVIGPAFDGGYYLIGFNFEEIGTQCEGVFEKIFLGKEWSHEGVCQEAKDACLALNLKCFELPTLTDVDEEKDYLKTKHLAL
ncbi:MAG: TIGR04282 family arsenosugar biosynthesis glycosyltransferase [Emticicia sp.]|nr:TIGR04282 family arsenosugar biosynthesis glycosyltransferase [Emticicia sp.]